MSPGKFVAPCAAKYELIKPSPVIAPPATGLPVTGFTKGDLNTVLKGPLRVLYTLSPPPNKPLPAAAKPSPTDKALPKPYAPRARVRSTKANFLYDQTLACPEV